MADALSLLQDRLRAVVHQPCWSVLAGPGTGSRVSIQLGTRVERPRPVRNNALTDEERRYQGYYRLFICCPWRLECSGGHVASWTYDNALGGPMLRGLDLMIDATVAQTELDPASGYLRLSFDNSVSLSLAGSEPEGFDTNDRYTLFEEGHPWITVSGRGRLSLND